VALALVILGAPPLFAQLDPLLFVKRVPPTVIVVVDTSRRMLEDGEGRYYDPQTYTVGQDLAAASALLGADATFAVTYRRVYHDLQFENVVDANTKFESSNITAVPNVNPAYATFWNSTRLEIAKAGVARAVSENASSPYRWGLVRLRQASPAWRESGNCDRPVRYTGANFEIQNARDSNPCNVGSSGRYGIYVPSVTAANFTQTMLGAGVLVDPWTAESAAQVRTIVERPILDGAGLIPTGRGAREHEDRPLTFALQDARAQAVAAMTADSASTRDCRNTIVVLVTGGKDDGDASYRAANNVLTTASSFLSVSGGGVTRRVPIYVVGVRPDPAHVAELETIATSSGGRYFAATTAADVAAAVNLAVQAGFTNPSNFDAGAPSEFQPVSPIVGTVNLVNALSATGASLPYTDIATSPGNQPIPQRSNMLITAGFELPGFEGRIRAFRTFVPEPDSTKPSGWKFVADGTRLWPDIDGRPALAGQARVPADPARRNIYTFIPGATPGTGSTVAFTTANVGALRPGLNVSTNAQAAALIDFVRAQSIGAVIGSTPALMDPPSLDPPPDDAYGRTDVPGTFAGTYKDRRSIIFVGGNNGMIHAIDARTGFEVWAFIPYNLLPKLRTLVDGQPMDQFDYFVDSSPKIAEVKVSGEWRSMLFIGQASGGTFYQAFDVTDAGMGVAPETDGVAAVDALLTAFASPTRIAFRWAFPDYASFDPTIFQSFAVADGTSGGRVTFYGDLKPTATFAEKSVGFTWSDPAVGPLDQNRTVNTLIVGSGYFPDVEDLLPGRGAAAPRAGRTLYLLRVEDGRPLGNPGGSACSGTGCRDVGNLAGNGRKNALQADPSAAAVDPMSHIVSRAYLGDVDGRYWRFNFTADGALTNTLMVDTGQPIYSSSALLFVGTADQYMFFSTGSDLLPVTTTGGTGIFKLFGLRDIGGSAQTRFTRNLTAVTSSAGVASGERASTAPSVAGDIVFYTTTSQSAAAPCANFTSNLYAMTYLGGAAYDSTGDNKVSANESPIVRTVAGRATAPFIVDQHLYFGTSGTAGADVEIFGDPEDFNNGVGQVSVRILSWREIR
jgi:hypothetical protein